MLQHVHMKLEYYVQYSTSRLRMLYTWYNCTLYMFTGLRECIFVTLFVDDLDVCA